MSLIFVKKNKKFVEFRADLLKTPTGVKRLEYALLLIQPFKEMESARRRSSMWGFFLKILVFWNVKVNLFLQEEKT